jgi:hypothetical protein
MNKKLKVQFNGQELVVGFLNENLTYIFDEKEPEKTFIRTRARSSF